MPVDIIIYAIIAGGLFFWLRSLLGETHGEERQRPNPFEEAGEEEAEIKPTPIYEAEGLDRKTQQQEPQNKPIALDPEILKDIDDQGIEKELFKISLADKNFNLSDFIENAQEAFVVIIDAYSEGDRETLEDMLAQQVYEPFIEAIEDREQRGEVVEMDVHAVKQADIRKAWMDEKMAYIAIRFVAKETVVIKNKDGKILSGNPDVVTEKIDVWTFGRNTKSSDPRWFLYETDMDDGVAFQDEHKTSENEASSSTLQ